MQTDIVSRLENYCHLMVSCGEVRSKPDYEIIISKDKVFVVPKNGAAKKVFNRVAKRKESLN